MDFAEKQNEGHLGPRKFWRSYLPRLKYHNPAISMTVHRTTNQSGPATMTIFLSTEGLVSVTPTTDFMTNEKVTTIDMKHRHESEILKDLLKITQAQVVDATPEEELQLQQLEEQRRQSEIDRERSKQNLEKRRQEARLLAQAREALSEAA